MRRSLIPLTVSLLATAALLHVGTVAAHHAAVRPANNAGPTCPDQHSSSTAQAKLACLAPSSGGAARADYNADGFTDLAIGVPYEDVGNVADAGIVQIMWGSASGFSPSRSLILQEGDGNVRGTLTAYDYFGFSIAGGDFDGNGYADLAIGVPGSNAAIYDSGAVIVLYSSSLGLGGKTRTQVLTEANSGGAAQAGDLFGSSVVWGQFGKGSYADLAIGAPYAPVGGKSQAGAVFAVYGSATGLTPGTWFDRRQGSGKPFYANDHWGEVLMAADQGGGQQALMVGAPNAFGGSEAGAVSEFDPGVNGLTPTGFEYDPVAEVSNSPHYPHGFGSALAQTDVDCDGQPDIVVGNPEHITANSVTVSYPPYYLIETDIVGAVEYFQLHNTHVQEKYLGTTASRLGTSLAVGDFDGDGLRDLAIGAPGGDVGGAVYAGYVRIQYVRECSQGLFHSLKQGSGGIAGTPEQDDHFGERLSAWNFGNGSQTDLAIGVPLEDIGSVEDAGFVQVLFGSSVGLTSSGQEAFTQDQFGLADETDDQFGWTLY
jgi:hypothetical protein